MLQKKAPHQAGRKSYVRGAPREMLNSTPIAAMVKMRDVLPALMSGSGSPVGGMEPLTTSALTSVCTAIAAVIPPASRKPNLSRLRAAVRTPNQMRSPNAQKRRMIPKAKIASQ